MRPLRCPALLVVAGLLVTGCDAGRPEASVCGKLGTFHRTSRDSLERLRVNDMASMPEWTCLTQALAALDEAFTSQCESGELGFGQVREEQRRVYAACFDPPRDGVVDKAVVRSLPGS